ncbi:hypothetical protein ACOSQ2_032157 [Xanthoceras sorbifolium]
MGKQEVISSEPYKDASKCSDWKDASASWGKTAEDTTGAKPWSEWGKQEVPATEACKDSSKSSDWKDAAASCGEKNVNVNVSWGQKMSY